jgi:hypothetical protein
MTDFAPVDGTPPEVGGTAGVRGVDSACAARVFDRVCFGFGFGVVSSFFGSDSGTPVGRIASGCNVWPKALKATAIPQISKIGARTSFMGGKLAIHFPTAQALHCQESFRQLFLVMLCALAFLREDRVAFAQQLLTVSRK